MPSRLHVWHAFDRQLRSLLPRVNRAHLHVFALLTLGLLWAESVTLPRIARTLPLGVKRASSSACESQVGKTAGRPPRRLAVARSILTIAIPSVQIDTAPLRVSSRITPSAIGERV